MRCSSPGFFDTSDQPDVQADNLCTDADTKFKELPTCENLISKIAANANKNIGEVTEEDYYNAEIAARQRNQNAYDEALVRYNKSAADSDARIGAKRDLLKFVIAYQYASLLQGGTGGRGGTRK